MFSLLMALMRDTSMYDNSILAGSKSTPSGWEMIPSLCAMGLSVITLPMTVARVVGILSGCACPKLIDSEPCGSLSTIKTFLPSCASPMSKLAQVVVLPTPPFAWRWRLLLRSSFFSSFRFWVQKRELAFLKN